jgi:hypothetical protein
MLVKSPPSSSHVQWFLSSPKNKVCSIHQSKSSSFNPFKHKPEFQQQQLQQQLDLE